VISSGRRRRTGEGASVVRRLVDVAVVVVALTPIVVLAALAILFMLIPVLPDSWTDSWVQPPVP
jgi:hypothetical protein